MAREENELEQFFTPSYASILDGIYKCHCGLKNQQSALKMYKEIVDFSQTHPDCIAPNFREELNKVFLKNFGLTPNVSIPSTIPSAAGIETGYAGISM